MKFPSSGPTSSGISRPPRPPSASIATPPKALSRLPVMEAVDPVQDATLLANVRLWDLRAYTQPLLRSRRCAPTTRFPIPTLIATSSTARSSRCCCRPREIDVNQLSAEAQRELDQSPFHLHARLWRGCRGGQQDHSRRPARPADRKRSAGNQIAGLSAHAAGNLLWREARRTRSLSTPRARNSIILPATRTNIPPTRAREASRSALFL